MNDSSPILPVRQAATRTLLAAIALTVILGACAPAVTPPPSSSPPSSSPSPSGLPSPSVIPSPTPINSAQAAAALVIASDARFAGLQAQDPNLIGQCCWWTATPTADGYDITIEIGWGDCPAGCIDRHQWFYSVATDGTITLDRENGPSLPAGIPGPIDGTTGGPGIRGIATAGPTCPVVTVNDPACLDRPVVGATVHVFDATGLEVATMETDATGSFVVTLPPGQYRVQADAVEGLMGTAPPADVTVGAALSLVQLVYDTGIR
jgi:hypothetical protein